MAKTRYIVRFYWQHDLDIIMLFLTRDFDVMDAMYACLSAFAKGESFVIEYPPEREAIKSNVRRCYSKSLLLDTDKDKKAIELLSKISDGYHNNFLKNLLRAYLCCPVTEDFVNDKDEFTYIKNMFKVFGIDRQSKNVGQRKSRQKNKTDEKAKKAELSSARKNAEGIDKDKTVENDADNTKASTTKKRKDTNDSSKQDDDDLFAMFKDMI